MKYYSLVLLTVLLLISINAGAMSFSDVPKNHWAYNDVKFLFDNGIIRGANFNGDENASRYYFATLIARMLETIEKGDLKVSDLNIEEYEKINRLAIEFANELNLFGYRLTKIGETLAYLRAEVEKKKREEQSEIQKVNEAKLDFTYDWRLRNDIKKFKSNNATILDENVLTQTFGINTNVNLGEGTSVFTRFEHNWGYHLFPGADWPSSERISMFYFNFEEGTETFTVGRQFFNIANALVFSNVNNGFKYEKILNEDTDLIIGATKESLGDNSNAFSTYYVNMLKYMDESVLNYYIITSRNPAVYNATTTAMLSPNIASRVNYYGVAYRTSTYNLRYFAEAVMFDYDKTVTDTNPSLNPGAPKKISAQLAYQLGMVKTMSPKTDMRVIYTHFDDYFKALKNDATLTLPDYDDQGYGFNPINTSGFDSIFLRFENYVDASTTLSYSVEYIKDNTTLAAGVKADDRMVYSIDFDKVLPGGYTLSVEYKYVDVENNANAKGFGSADINPILPSIPYQQDTLRITMTHNF